MQQTTLNQINPLLKNIEKVTITLKVISIFLSSFIFINLFIILTSIIKIPYIENIHKVISILIPLLGMVLVLLYGHFRKIGNNDFEYISEEIEAYFKNNDTHERIPPNIKNSVRKFAKASDLPFFNGENGHFFYFIIFAIFFLWSITINFILK